MVYRILCIDGGGIRGTISATLLSKIEETKLNGSPIFNTFDMFAGTSTGSIIAAGLALEMSAKDILGIYQTRGRTIFPYQSRWSPARIGPILQFGPSAPKYSDRGLNKVLEKELGQSTFKSVKDKGKRLVITSYDTISRSKLNFDSDDDQFAAVPVWRAAVCSSAAPTFFPAQLLELDQQKYSLIDGGVVANNPSVLAIAQAINSGIKLEEIKVLSIGTGDPTRSIPYESAREWGALEWAAPIVDVLFDGSADINDFIASQLIGSASRYVRLQFRLDSNDFKSIGNLNDDIDDASPENLEALIQAGEQFYALNSSSLDLFL